MPDLSAIAQYPLKVIFSIHLILTTWAMQGSWCPTSVMFYNLLFFVCLLWAIHNIESDEPLQLALLINVLSILFDVVTLAVNFPTYLGASEKFSASIMIINMLARLVTSGFLLKIGQARGGTLATMFPPGPGMEFSNRPQYEDISYPVAQNADFAGI